MSDLRLATGASATTTSLVLDPDLSYEKWSEIGAMLFGIAKATPWWIGDWINFGETSYGERYAQAIELTGLDKGTIITYAWVARHVPRHRRREELSFSAHRAVAKLDGNEQRTKLALAVRESLGSKELAALVRDGDGSTRVDLDDVVDLRSAASAVWHASRLSIDGTKYEVPSEPMAVLAAALATGETA